MSRRLLAGTEVEEDDMILGVVVFVTGPTTCACCIRAVREVKGDVMDSAKGACCELNGNWVFEVCGCC